MEREIGRVRLEKVTKHFGADVVAVSEVALEIPPGCFFALLGPSGCGKSTLLRMIAGLEEPSSGRIVIDGRDVTGVTAQSRPTAMVFQSYALFPSMTVEENVAYGLHVRKIDRSARGRRVEEALDRVGLSGVATRPVTALSGGQQQRVALARALVVEPSVMLFDEPLSNLDVALRERTRGMIRKLQKSLGTTSVYVTHDQEEAMVVADLIAVMRAGKIVQVGPPEEVYNRPRTAYVASFLGGSNIIRDPDLAGLIAGRPDSPEQVLSIRPEDFEPAEDGPVQGPVVGRQYLGARAEWEVDANGTIMRIRLPASIDLGDTASLTATSHRWVHDDL